MLPWNPQGLPGVAPDLAWNTAASFTTNTNWQSYVPEAVMSYFTEMVGLAYHNFLSAAVGIAVGYRPGARHRPQAVADHWQFLGRLDTDAPVDPAARLPDLGPAAR